MKNIENVNRENKLDLRNGEKDRTSKWYGKLQAIRQTEVGEGGKYNWLCLCSCLGTREVSGVALDMGEATQCGCEDVEDDEEELPRTPNFQRPSWMTQGQLDLLMLIVPGPLGSGMKVVDAAKKLGITHEAATQRLGRFAKRFPVAWERVEAMRNTMQRQGLTTHKRPRGKGMQSFEELQENFGRSVVDLMIVCKF